jgi:hypothetical protein
MPFNYYDQNLLYKGEIPHTVAEGANLKTIFILCLSKVSESIKLLVNTRIDHATYVILNLRIPIPSLWLGRL